MNATSENHLSFEPHMIPPDRRTTSRFPMRAEVTYTFRHGKVVGGGAGKCVNIGSGGVLFTTVDRLPIGRTVEVSIAWPALLDGACPLKFIASGPVVRTEDDRAAIRIDRYEFRTRATRPGLAAALTGMVAPVPIRPRA
jgi:hypothetical protein